MQSRRFAYSRTIMSPKKRARYVAYCRVSTTEQARDGASLDAQEKRLRGWAIAQDVDLATVVRDEGASAKTLDRPGLQRVFGMLDSGEADGMVVVKLDRLTRSTRDLLRLADERFGEDGAELVSVSESVDTATPGGRLVLTVLGAVATWEREAGADRTSETLRHLRREGVAMGRAPYGYTYAEEQDAEGRRPLVKHEAEQATLRRAKRLRRAGLSLRAVGAKLDEEGRQTRRGGKWSASSLRQVLGEAPARRVGV